MEKPNKKQVLLFYCVEAEELARKNAAQSDLINLQSINWRSFDDSFPNLFINNAQDIRGQHWLLLAHQQSYLSNCLLYLLFRGYLLHPSHWSYHFFQLDPLREWKRKEMLPQLLQWQGYYPTFQYQGVDQLVWSYMTYMLCRKGFNLVTMYYHCLKLASPC